MNTPSATPAPPLKFAIALALIGALGPSAIDMYLASMPSIALEYGTSYAGVQLTLTVFLLALGAGQLLFGPVVDVLGRRRPLLVGLLVFVLSSLLAARADSLDALLIARFIQGLGSALTLVVIMSMVRDVAEGARAAQIFALLMTIIGLSPVIAPALGGIIGAGYGWRAIMLTLAALGALVLLNATWVLKETLPADKRLAWSQVNVLSTYLRIARDANFLRPALALSAVFFFLFAYIAGAAYVYQSHFGLSVKAFGLLFGATGVAVLLGAFSAGRLVARKGLARLAQWGAGCMVLGALLVLLGALTSAGLAGIVAGMFVAMFGLGIAEAALMALVMGSQSRALGSTAALLGALQMSISSLATPLSGIIAPLGSGYWAILLALSAMVVAVLVRASTRGLPIELNSLADH
ncbi:Bcr/CflA family efflux MFS transporter [Pseudomonas fontis]|uniref:Bcr/CflA family efflux transporter n=1 Tax=Pseudomonas fontis TaxID=2942633 RepID=A0ABT5NUD3_9PSED|nr:Bcr/CflA family efflux MFS transporter [Pseudomonas fontis]MDD0973939.1 Bcr/CflA family efflux MFS transporter [Pseudomonas fontis]MDD0991781.1 Bcr/CflA family efflux MFS transporter [Pseudomonas fontis]